MLRFEQGFHALSHVVVAMWDELCCVLCWLGADDLLLLLQGAVCLLTVTGCQ
jgi:hypothetical protein